MRVAMSNKNEITEEDFQQEHSSEEQNFKFEAEVNRKHSYQKIVVAALIFLVALAAIIGAFYIGKSRLDEWRADRAFAAAEKRNEARAGTSRQGRSFETDFYQSEEPSLPDQFGDPKPKPKSTPPIPLLQSQPTQPAAATQAKPEAAPEAPPLFAYPEKKKSENYENVQEYAAMIKANSAPTETGQSSASKLGDRSFVLARGSQVPCVLETQLVSNIAGQTSCIISQNIYSDDGSRLLIPRGSSAIGSYGETMQLGDERIAVIWDRIKTTDGNVIDVDSGAADAVGTMGVGGHVENHWGKRIGAAMLLSLIDDAVDITVAEQSSGNNYGQSTSRSTKNLAEKVLDSTINIKPTLSTNRGARLMIFVSKDLWFDDVYED